jgi:hypothetical protein
MHVKTKKVIIKALAFGLLLSAIGFNTASAAPAAKKSTSDSKNSDFTLDVIQEVIGLEVTVTSPEGNYLGQYASIETDQQTINRTVHVKNIGNVNLQVSGYSDPVTKDGAVYSQQNDFDVKYNYESSGKVYSSLQNGNGITNAQVITPKLAKGAAYNASIDFSILNQVDPGQYKFSFYHIGEYTK